MKVFTDLVEAASQSAKQAVQTRQAQRKALAAAKEREKARLEKERKAAEKKRAEKEQKDKERAEKQAAEKARKEAEKRRKEEEKNNSNGTGGERRRGRGTDELSDGTDISVLTTRFPNCDVQVVQTMDEFINLAPMGLPIIWRARRMPSRKVLEAADPDADSKTISSGTTLLKTEFKQKLSEFAQTTAQEPMLVKRPLEVSEQAQELTQSLRMDSVLKAMLETRLAPNEENEIDMPHPCAVMEEEVLQSILEKTKADLDVADASSAQSRASEICTWSKLHMVGFQHGKTFSGVCQGLWPFVTYQLEGTRAVAFVSIDDVPCLTLYEYSVYTNIELTIEIDMEHTHWG